MILLMMMMIHLSQVGQGLNNIRRLIPCKVIKPWMISLKDSTNDLGLTGYDPPSRTRMLLTPMIAFEPCLELKNSLSGVLDVGYVYHSKLEEKYLAFYY